MRRRRFIVATGSAVLAGSAINSVKRPALGLDFELSAVPDTDPSNVESIVINFEKLELTPKYLNDDEKIDITLRLDFGGSKVKSKEFNQIGFSNYERLNIQKIADRTGKDASKIRSGSLDPNSDSKGKITVSVNHPDISETYQKYFQINSYRGFWDDWADQPSDTDLIDNRRSFSDLQYQGNSQSRAPESGLRPTWNISQGTASVQDTPEHLSLGRNCLVEYNGIDLTKFDFPKNNIVIRFKYEFYNGNRNSSDTGFNLTVSNPGGGNSDNFAGYPEDGYTMYFGGGTVYSFSEHSGGSRTDLIVDSWASDDKLHVSKLVISDAGSDGLMFEYFYDGSSVGTATSNTFSLQDISTLHFGNRDDPDAENAPAGIKWLEIYQST